MLIVGGGIWALRIWDQKQLPPPAETSSDQTVPLLGADRDEYGCLNSAGYSWCESSQKCQRLFEEFCPDVVSNLVRVINQNMGIVFSGPVNKSFNWIVGDEQSQVDVSIDGLSYQAENLTMNGVLAVENFLNNLSPGDSYNLADGFEGGQRGYYFNYMVCLYDFRHAELEEKADGSLQPVGDDLNIELSCGYFNPNLTDNLAINQAIKEKFAQKYERNLDEISINITTSTPTHMRGSVKFGIADEPGEGGIFFAALVDDEWQLVFDGNGIIPCDLLIEYNFPEDFQADCAQVE